MSGATGRSSQGRVGSPSELDARSTETVALLSQPQAPVQSKWSSQSTLASPDSHLGPLMYNKLGEEAVVEQKRRMQ